MPIHDVSGIGGFYMLYLCIVKTAPSRPPRGEGGWQSQRLKTGPYTTKALSANGSN